MDDDEVSPQVFEGNQERLREIHINWRRQFQKREVLDLLRFLLVCLSQLSWMK